jgi:acyl carrier protein
MNAIDHFPKLTSILEQYLGVDAKQVKMDSRFVEDLGADSLDVVELVMAVEEEWGISLLEEEVEKLTTVQLLLEHIEENAE